MRLCCRLNVVFATAARPASAGRARPGWLVAACLGLFFQAFLAGSAAQAELPSPILNSVFPAGGPAGASISVAVQGTSLDGLTAVRFSNPRITSQKGDGNQFVLTIPSDVPPGVYDLRAIGTYGVSGPRAFFVGKRPESRDAEPNETLDQAQPVELDGVVNGRLEKPGDIDCYQFSARAGQRVVLELWAGRLDSPLRGILEVYDSQRRRVAVNRGYSGTDPLVDFGVPADGVYFVKLSEQTYLGSSDHVYRLEIDTGPRVEFAVPAVVTQGQPARVTLFGRNLRPPQVSARPEPAPRGPFDEMEIDLPPAQAGPMPMPLRSAQTVFEAFPYYYPGAHAPLLIGVTNVPVVVGTTGNHHPEQAQEIAVPCEVSGQLTSVDQHAWFAVRARKGEVLWIEALGARIGAPVDLDIIVADEHQRELLHLSDNLQNLGGTRFPTDHTDPAGRFVVPADGKYLILVRNLIGGPQADPRQVYRLAVRREEPDFHLTVVPRRADQPTGLNVWRGGREMAEIFAVRRRGLTGPIRVTAENLPSGMQCPDVWLGAGEDRAPLIVSASRDAPAVVASLTLFGQAEASGLSIRRPVRGGTMVRPGHPTGWGRLTDDVPVALAPQASLGVSATPGESHVFQDSILDVAIDVERGPGAEGPIHLTGVGLPHGMDNPVATIPAGSTRGWLSFAIPGSLASGPFTFAVQAETEISLNNAKIGVTTFSNPITIQVSPARIRVLLDPRTPRKVARGQIIHVKYQAERLNGFIGKIHTELAAPGGVSGIRGRGVTFTGQQETGEIQVIATEDAPRGRLPFLRLEAVGTVEDQPACRGSRFLELEITE